MHKNKFAKVVDSQINNFNDSLVHVIQPLKNDISTNNTKKKSNINSKESLSKNIDGLINKNIDACSSFKINDKKIPDLSITIRSKSKNNSKIFKPELVHNENNFKSLKNSSKEKNLHCIINVNQFEDNSISSKQINPIKISNTLCVNNDKIFDTQNDVNLLKIKGKTLDNKKNLNFNENILYEKDQIKNIRMANFECQTDIDKKDFECQTNINMIDFECQTTLCKCTANVGFIHGITFSLSNEFNSKLNQNYFISNEIKNNDNISETDIIRKSSNMHTPINNRDKFSIDDSLDNIYLKNISLQVSMIDELVSNGNSFLENEGFNKNLLSDQHLLDSLKCDDSYTNIRTNDKSLQISLNNDFTNSLILSPITTNFSDKKKNEFSSIKKFIELSYDSDKENETQAEFYSILNTTKSKASNRSKRISMCYEMINDSDTDLSEKENNNHCDKIAIPDSPEIYFDSNRSLKKCVTDDDVDEDSFEKFIATKKAEREQKIKFKVEKEILDIHNFIVNSDSDNEENNDIISDHSFNSSLHNNDLLIKTNDQRQILDNKMNPVWKIQLNNEEFLKLCLSKESNNEMLNTINVPSLSSTNFIKNTPVNSKIYDSVQKKLFDSQLNRFRSNSMKNFIFEDSDDEMKEYKSKENDDPNLLKPNIDIIPTTIEHNSRAFPQSAIEPRQKLSFLSSLSDHIPDHKRDYKALNYLKKFKELKDQLAHYLFNLYNEKVFNNEFSKDTIIFWNKLFTKSAGVCVYGKNSNEERNFKIELSTKVCDSAERLRDTLIHEMCHAYVWVHYGVHDGHGNKWKYWARKANMILPDLPAISRCHSYTIVTKFIYKCTTCGAQIGRHTKSLDIEQKVCGICQGKFELFKRSKNTTDKNNLDLVTPKTPNQFALFVKENFDSVRKMNPNSSHKDIMTHISRIYQSAKK